MKTIRTVCGLAYPLLVYFEPMTAVSPGNAKNNGVQEGGGGSFCVHGLTNQQRDANLIYRQEHGGMYRSSDGGDNWVLIESGLPKGILMIHAPKVGMGWKILVSTFQAGA